MTSTGSTVQTYSCTTCILCGAQGALVYQGLIDSTGALAGHWDIRRCTNTSCGLLWVDPKPNSDEIWKAYQKYFTHKDHQVPIPRRHRRLTNLLRKISKPISTLFVHLSGLRIFEKEVRKKAGFMYLGHGQPGHRLLDVGCGNGSFLAVMKGIGWVVEGTETDLGAVENALDIYGLKIHHGRLEELNLKGDSFDAITMNHVIEHVHDPVSLLKECFRLLKPGGKIILTTPNPDSLGHQLFREHWICLFPPSHLHLFSQAALQQCAKMAGFHFIETWSIPPGNTVGIGLDSIFLREQSMGDKFEDVWQFPRAFLFRIRELAALRRGKGIGEENVLVGLKQEDGTA
jgi:2-polyprenyl-3-methyl-5-hydroxy-6-metoxy-1,4-benzoquinol methylase